MNAREETHPDSCNALSYWFPAVQRAGVLYPRTAIVRCTEDYAETSLFNLLDGKEPTNWAAFLADVEGAIQSVGGYPAFLRTGWGSGKHEWRETCHVPSADALGAHIAAIVNWSACVDWRGLPVHEWVARELLPTEPAFHAFEGMPITCERRYFVDNGAVIGWHPYWPPEAFSWGMDCDDWPAKLDALNEPATGEVECLTELSHRVGSEIGGAWSIDWLRLRSGVWYCTDMALYETSFVWSDYPTAPTAPPQCFWTGEMK